MAGYSEFSKSNNAIQAERDGLFPKTKAAQVIAKTYGVTLSVAKAYLAEQTPREWHHTSCRFNATDYFNTDLDEDEVAKLKATLPIGSKKREKRNGSFQYNEWGGTRNYPKCYTYIHVGEYEVILDDYGKAEWYVFGPKSTRKKHTNVFCESKLQIQVYFRGSIGEKLEAFDKFFETQETEILVKLCESLHEFPRGRRLPLYERLAETKIPEVMKALEKNAHWVFGPTY